MISSHPAERPVAYLFPAALPTTKLSGSTFCVSKAGKLWSVIVYGLHSYSAACKSSSIVMQQSLPHLEQRFDLARTVTMALSLWYGLRLYRSLKPVPSGVSLLKIFYLDGIFYFVVIEGMSIRFKFSTPVLTNGFVN